jgi:hypothetical protein
MEHTKDMDLIEFVAKRLDPDRENAVLRHLENCSVCRDKLADLQGTWDVLGAWEASPASHRGLERSVSTGPQADTARSHRVIRFPSLATVARVAASMIVVAAIGYVGGRGSVGEAAAAERFGPPEYISALSLEVGESFSALVFEDEASAGEEDGA